MQEKIQNHIKFVKETFLDALYPRTCALCASLLNSKEKGICTACALRLKPLREPLCKKCGKPLRDVQEEFCFDCRRHKHIFSCNQGIFPYNEQMQGAIARWKFQGRREYSAFFGQVMYYYGKDYIAHCRPQAIFSMPLHKYKEKSRGFDQAKDLAKIIQSRTQIPYMEDFLIRKKNTRAMKALDSRQRKQNIKGAFALVKDIPGLKRVLVIDDIYTTGASLDEVSKVLKEAGIEEIYCMTLCVGES